MADKDKCKTVSELLPLLIAGSLPTEQRERVLAHLRECTACQQLLREELPLYVAALCRNSDAPLSEMPGSEMLDRFALDPKSLTQVERDRVQGFLEAHGWARELVDKLQLLPHTVEELVEGRQLPILNHLDSISMRKQKEQSPSIIKRIFWNPAAAYAIAAVLLLAFLIVPRAGDQEPDILPAFLPSAARSTGQPPVFESTSRVCYLHLTHCVAPEPKHVYDISVKRSDETGYLFFKEDFRDFDQRGCIELSLLIEMGRYELMVLDVVDGDTVATSSPFILRQID